jgi:glycosyltransferase involved in cell wall biosynthesis
MIKIIHIITDLKQGGAETTLFKLLSGIERSKFENYVVSLREEGVFSTKIKQLGFDVKCLNYPPGVPNPKMIYDTMKVINNYKPDLTKTWMYHGNLIGGLAGCLGKRSPIIWGIRHGSMDTGSTKTATRLVAQLGAKLSKFIPTKIVVSSDSSLEYHASIGYSREKLVVIHNGVNLDDFRPDVAKRQTMRSELGFGPDELVIGTVSRFHQDKDIPTFLNAASILLRDKPYTKFVLCGHGLTVDNLIASKYLADSTLLSACHLLGPRVDIPEMLNGLDIFTLPSATESFPNVLVEAMASGLPCVTTDVGDCAFVVGDTGLIVPPQNPEALAQAWSQLSDMTGLERENTGEKARQRVIEYFTLGKMVASFEELFTSCV